MLNYTVKYNNQTIFTSSTPLASIPIKYNNETKATLTTPTTIILPTKDKYCNSNILIGNIILPTNNKCMRDNILVDTVHAIHLVTSAEILAAIKLYRGSYSFSVLTDLVLGSSGLSITGVTTRDVGATTYYGDNGCMVLPIDLSQYSSVSYYAKKGANHGCLSVGITDSIPTTSTVYNATLLNSIGYGSFSTDWVKYTHDLSSYSGTKYLIFAGGYADKTGSTSSNTLYCNIIFD